MLAANAFRLRDRVAHRRTAASNSAGGELHCRAMMEFGQRLPGHRNRRGRLLSPVSMFTWRGSAARERSGFRVRRGARLRRWSVPRSPGTGLLTRGGQRHRPTRASRCVRTKTSRSPLGGASGWAEPPIDRRPKGAEVVFGAKRWTSIRASRRWLRALGSRGVQCPGRDRGLSGRFAGRFRKRTRLTVRATSLGVRGRGEGRRFRLRRREQSPPTR